MLRRCGSGNANGSCDGPVVQDTSIKQIPWFKYVGESFRSSPPLGRTVEFNVDPVALVIL
jgi:hypothetical protein